MSDQFIGEIRMFANNFPPRGWASCQGSFQAISQYEALFALIGTTYGGDGRTTFQLPNLGGRTPINHGQGPGLSPRAMGYEVGSSTVTLAESNLPAHSHTAYTSFTNDKTQITSNPQGAYLSRSTNGVTSRLFTSAPSPDEQTMMSSSILSNAGQSAPHENMQPFLVVNYVIAQTGVFPSHS